MLSWPRSPKGMELSGPGKWKILITYPLLHNINARTDIYSCDENAKIVSPYKPTFMVSNAGIEILARIYVVCVMLWARTIFPIFWFSTSALLHSYSGPLRKERTQWVHMHWLVTGHISIVIFGFQAMKGPLDKSSFINNYCCIIGN